MPKQYETVFQHPIPMVVGSSGINKSDTLNPANPAFGFDPFPTAPSSRISPPEPVAAPGNGETAVG